MKSIQNQFIIDIFYKKLCCLFSKILSITFIFRNRQIMMLLFSCRIYNKYVCRQIGQITINVMNEYQIWSLLLMEQIVKPVKAELPQEDILFRTQQPLSFRIYFLICKVTSVFKRERKIEQNEISHQSILQILPIPFKSRCSNISNRLSIVQF